MKFSTIFQVAFALGAASSAVAAPSPDNSVDLMARALDRRVATFGSCVSHIPVDELC